MRFLLNQVSLSHRLTLCWIPGHSGISANEMADSLAKSASHSSLLPSLDFLTFFPTVLTTRFYRKLRYDQTLQFTSVLQSCSSDYSFLNFHIDYSLFPDRFSEVQFCRFRHLRGMTREYGAHFCGLSSALCNCRIPFSVDTADHFFCFCKFLHAERLTLSGVFADHHIPFSLSSILSLGASSFPSLPKALQCILASAIANFLHQAKSKGFLRF